MILSDEQMQAYERVLSNLNKVKQGKDLVIAAAKARENRVYGLELTARHGGYEAFYLSIMTCSNVDMYALRCIRLPFTYYDAHNDAPNKHVELLAYIAASFANKYLGKDSCYNTSYFIDDKGFSSATDLRNVYTKSIWENPMRWQFIDHAIDVLTAFATDDLPIIPGFKAI